LLLAIALAYALSRFSPVVNFVETLQERVMGWGTWAAIGYPLLFALCNILLLPGGIFAVGGGFFFGLWWGFFIVLRGNSVAWSFFIRLCRHTGAICNPHHARQKLPPYDRLLDLGRSVHHNGFALGRTRAGSISSHPNVPVIGRGFG